jgi:hypothetical protein
MMGTGGRHGDGPLGRFLSFHVGIIERIAAERAAGGIPLKRGGRNIQLLGVETDGLSQGSDGDDIQSVDDGTFLGIRDRHNQAAHSLLAGSQGHRENALRRADGPVECQFAGRSKRGKTGRRELSAGAEQSQGDGQVERGGLFRQIGRRQVDDDAVDGPRISAVDKRPLDAVHAFFDSRFGEADKYRLWQRSRRNVDFDFHWLGFDSKERVRKKLGEH